MSFKFNPEIFTSLHSSDERKWAAIDAQKYLDAYLATLPRWEARRSAFIPYEFEAWDAQSHPTSSGSDHEAIIWSIRPKVESE